jgi:hypothetical protein
MFFINALGKHILDLNSLKDVKPIGGLIELRDVKDFYALPSMSEQDQIEG